MRSKCWLYFTILLLTWLWSHQLPDGRYQSGALDGHYLWWHQRSTTKAEIIWISQKGHTKESGNLFYKYANFCTWCVPCGTIFCHDALVCLDKRYWRTKSFSQSIIINQLPCWKSVLYLFDCCKLSCVAAKAGVELDFLFFLTWCTLLC